MEPHAHRHTHRHTHPEPLPPTFKVADVVNAIEHDFFDRDQIEEILDAAHNWKHVQRQARRP